MNKLQLYARIVPIRNILLRPSTFLKDVHFENSTKTSGSSSGSSSSSDSDINISKPNISDRKKENDATLSKLNTLLRKLVEDDVIRSKSKLDLAKPNKRIKKDTDDSCKIDSVEKQMVNAVKNVAETIGGDVKQTESELLLKLLSPVEPSITTNLSDVVKGMKIDRESKSVNKSRAEEVRSILQKVRLKSAAPREHVHSTTKPKRHIEQKRKPEKVVQKINLFGSEPLAIFTNKDLKETSENETWQSLYHRDLKLAITHPQANYFQQMILWTEQGKLWKFPIDNEQGLEEEKSVYFAKHIFLEEHLEPWCPPKGPIRHFMELVCVGLSKNSYLTVEAKREHIEWFRNYFEDKKKILQDVGILPIQDKPQKTLQ